MCCPPDRPCLPIMRKAGLSTPNRSLSRGLQILRAFRPGVEILSNGELAEQTGLPRATVSRLTQTLQHEGMLEYDAARRAYRLGVPVLGWAFSLRSSSTVLHQASPLMENLARRARINVGIAVADGDDMVYLESIRLSSRKSVRTVMPGQRIPMETTSLGRAWLATLPAHQVLDHYARFRLRHPDHWPLVRQGIEDAIRHVHAQGYCIASWLPDVVAVGVPVLMANGPVYALNASMTTEESGECFARRVSAPLLDLAETLSKRCG